MPQTLQDPLSATPPPGVNPQQAKPQEPDKNARKGKAKKRKNRGKRGGQTAVTVRDGVAVYKFPNFDAPILDYLSNGKRVRISKRVL